MGVGASRKTGLGRVSTRPYARELLKFTNTFSGERGRVPPPAPATGTPGDYWTTFALVPDILQMSRDSLFALLQPGRVLKPRFRELAILRTGIVGDSKFEYSQHLKVARTVGIAEEKLQAIKGWTTSDKFDAAERAAMAAADELVGRNLVEDATFAALKQHFSDEQIMELIFVIATWRMHGMIVRALHLEYDNDTTARMQEVPASPPKSG